MEIHQVSRHWRQMLVSCVVVVAVIATGLQAADCGGQCGYKTYCSPKSSFTGEDTCECEEGYGGRSHVTGSNPRVYYCHQICNMTKRVCLAKTVCEYVSPKKYYCICASGFAPSSSGQCEDKDECLEDPNICGKNSNCSNTEGNYTCQCVAGYYRRNGEDIGCHQDVDECLEYPDICGKNTLCLNTEGSYMCECVEGYSQGNGEELSCSQGPEICSSGDNSRNKTTDDITTDKRKCPGQDFPTTGVVQGAVIGLVALLAIACSFSALVIVRRRRFTKRYKKRIALKLRRQKKQYSETGRSGSIVSDEGAAISVPAQRHEPTDAVPAQLPCVLSSNSHMRSSVTSLGGNSRLSYEIVDIPSQKEQSIGLFSLCKEGESLNDFKVLDERGYNELYANYKIKGEKAKQLALMKANTDAATATNSPRATQMAAGSDLGNINGSFKNSEVLDPADYDQLYANHKIKHMKAKQVAMTKASIAVTPTSSWSTRPGTNKLRDVNNLDSLDGTFENYKMIQPPSYDELYGNCRIAQNTTQAVAAYIKDSFPGDSEYDRPCLPSAIPQKSACEPRHHFYTLEGVEHIS